MQAANNADDDWLDYNNELRIGILEAYSGILQGLGPGMLTEHCTVQEHLLENGGCTSRRLLVAFDAHLGAHSALPSGKHMPLIGMLGF